MFQAIFLHLQREYLLPKSTSDFLLSVNFMRNLLTLHHVLVTTFIHSSEIYLIPSEFKQIILRAYMPYLVTKFSPSFSI